MQPLEFILSINSKLYKYETEMPTSQQAAFLVTMVRCWRRYMTGSSPFFAYALPTYPSTQVGISRTSP